MRARSGFTLIELLIACGIGMTIVGLSVQQLWEFFRLQSLLMAKTQLRLETQQAQDKISQKVRYAVAMVDAPPDGVMIAVPKDVDRCGYVCGKDTFDIVWWHVTSNPMRPGMSALTEQTLTIPAFSGGFEAAPLLPFFATAIGTSRQIAVSMDKIQLLLERKGLYRSVLQATRPIPRRPEPVTIGLTELIAVRSQPYESGVPPFEEAVEKHIRNITP